MRRLSLVCLFGLFFAVTLVNPAHCYARVIRVEVTADARVKIGEHISVRADIYTGNNLLEVVTDVKATLIIPETAKLISGDNPVVIGRMGPGPASTYCNWTLVFDLSGTCSVTVNVTCTDTQLMHRWLANSTTVAVYDFPHAEFAYSGNLYVNETVFFDASKSYSGSPGGEILTYYWNLGDGTSITMSGPVVEHVFRTVGNQTILLNVTDSEGLSSTTVGSIRIRLFGDITSDNVINILDISIVASSVGSHLGDGKWNADADLNGDNAIDIIDVSIVAVRYGTTA